jgi:hypothetical protein
VLAHADGLDFLDRPHRHAGVGLDPGIAAGFGDRVFPFAESSKPGDDQPGISLRAS